MPLYDLQLIPEGNMYFQTDVFKNQAGKAALGEKVVLLQTKEYQERNALTEDNIYPIGVSGIISEISPDGYIVVKINNRVNIDEVSIDDNKQIELSISRRPDSDKMDLVIKGGGKGISFKVSICSIYKFID